MGTTYTFNCPNCGESVFSSEGRDCGFIAVIQPMICEDCNDLVSVLIGQFGKEGPTGDPEYDKDLNLCPNCRGTNLRSWPSNYPCLRCGREMKKSEEPMIDWD